MGVEGSVREFNTLSHVPFASPGANVRFGVFLSLSPPLPALLL